MLPVRGRAPTLFPRGPWGEPAQRSRFLRSAAAVASSCTETALKGNPLAVVLNTTNLTTERMQAIAREFNLSETTFVERRPAEVERAEGVRVRIFTTQEELNF